MLSFWDNLHPSTSRQHGFYQLQLIVKTWSMSLIQRHRDIFIVMWLNLESTKKTNLWIPLQRSFQKGLIEERRLTLDVDETTFMALGSELNKKRKQVKDLYSSLSADEVCLTSLCPCQEDTLPQ